MKLLTFITLATCLFAMKIATAATPTDEEIFSVIDSEYSINSDQERINFSMSASDFDTTKLDDVLKGVDAEYGHTGVVSRFGRTPVPELPRMYD